MNDSKPAFPTPRIPGQDVVDDQPAKEGMSLREWYAGLAMQGFLANPNIIKGADEFAQCSEDILFVIERMSKLMADKMVEEKQQ